MAEQQELAELRGRLTRLEAVEALRRLKAEYARCCDPTHDVAGMLDLLTDDAVFDIGKEFGCYSGKEEIRAFLEQADGIIPWAIHYMIAPIIDMDPSGHRAEGSWYLWQLASMPHPSEDRLVPVLIAGTYHDSFVKDGERWRFSRIRLRMQIMSPFEDGWVKTPWIGR